MIEERMRQVNLAFRLSDLVDPKVNIVIIFYLVHSYSLLSYSFLFSSVLFILCSPLSCSFLFSSVLFILILFCLVHSYSLLSCSFYILVSHCKQLFLQKENRKENKQNIRFKKECAKFTWRLNFSILQIQKLTSLFLCLVHSYSLLSYSFFILSILFILYSFYLVHSLFFLSCSFFILSILFILYSNCK